MPLHDLKREVNYAVVTHAHKIAFTSNDLELATRRRDQIDPTWRIVRITTLYSEII
jgi:hypothetical protein